MEAGEFSAKAVQGDFGYTSNGNEQVAVEIQLLDGPAKGQSLTWYGNFSDEPAGDHTRTEWTLIDLRKLGWDGKNLAALDGLGSSTVRVKVEEEEYNGRRQFKIKRIFAGGGLALKNRMTDEQKRALAAKVMGGKKPTDAAKDDDDLPF